MKNLQKKSASGKAACATFPRMGNCTMYMYDCIHTSLSRCDGAVAECGGLPPFPNLHFHLPGLHRLLVLSVLYALKEVPYTGTPHHLFFSIGGTVAVYNQNVTRNSGPLKRISPCFYLGWFLDSLRTKHFSIDLCTMKSSI